MTKRTESKYKIDRRLNVNLWGRAKSPINKREYGPGQHGQRRKKPSDYGVQLMAKQKLKGYYGNISERQFRKYYAEALRRKGDNSENLIGILESRLDTIVYHHWYDLDTGKRTNGTGNTKTCPGTAFFGGNTTEAAAANFIPLVVAALTGVAVPAPPTVLSLGSYTVNAPALNVRTGPAATQKFLKQLTKGILVDAFEANGDWLRVHSTEQHWVNKRFVTAVATG